MLFVPDWLFIDAVRYAIGRRTYYPAHDITLWLMVHWKGIPESIKEQIIFDVEEAFKLDRLGDEFDKKNWEDVRTLWRGVDD